MGQKFFDMHESSRLNMSFKCSGAFNIIYIMRIRIAEGEKQPPSVNQSYNQRPDLADAIYCVPPALYAHLMDILEDEELGRIIDERANERVIEVNIDDL